MLATVLVQAAGGEEVLNPILPTIPDLVWSAVVFVILLVAFWFLILPRVKTMLDERASLIEGGIKKAEAAQAEAASALDKYTEQLAEARAEAAQIREQARTDGSRILAELKEQAQTEAARILSNATTQIEAERQGALVSLRAEVGSLAIDLASGVIGESLADDKRSAAVVDRFLAELEASEGAKK